MDNKIKRFAELDLLKGIAVILMVYFHFFYLAFLLKKPIISLDNFFLNLSAEISHNIFIIIFGINLVISFYKNNYKQFIKKQFTRFYSFLLISLLITSISYILFPKQYVIFGIFHFLTLSILVSQLFVFNLKTTFIGILIFIIINIHNHNFFNFILNKCTNFTKTCFILGFNDFNFESIDHFPFIIYYLVVLFGMTLGHLLYKNGEQKLQILSQNILQSNISKSLIYIGSKSLPIYILHWIIFYVIIKKLY